MPSFFKRPRFRSKRYLDWIRSKPCRHCDPRPDRELDADEPKSDAHHWHETDGGTALKCGDQYTVPLCKSIPGTGKQGCHDAWHSSKRALPGLTTELSRQAFARWQRELMAEWIARHGEASQDSLF